MSESETEKNIYDLNQLEDMFEVIDSLTRATSLLSSIDGQLASELVKLTNTLMHFSESGQTIGVQADTQSEKEVAPKEVAPKEEAIVEEASDNGIVDLTVSSSRKTKGSLPKDDGDVIVDVLTGERIKK